MWPKEFGHWCEWQSQAGNKLVNEVLVQRQAQLPVMHLVAAPFEFDLAWANAI